ncbi:MAG: hypothetical protein A2X64_05675 [Ignavibacteria bacterium GWF2_33_9]|nr:MAG: hypothetical protein A2X64_05675 [Ignavibacteria bacterium GWF2_33_9]
MIPYAIAAVLFFSLFTLESCETESREEIAMRDSLYKDSVRKADSIKAYQELVAARDIPPIADFPEIKYTLFKFTSQSARAVFFDSLKRVPNFSEKVLKLLNRKEYRFVVGSEEIVIPDVFYEDTRAYSVFPSYYPAAKDIHKLLMVTAHYQMMALYEWGVLVRVNAVNSGKEKTPSYPGKYSLIFRQLERHSSIDSSWIMKYYFNFSPEAGMAFHQFVMPGYPASHSCMRMFLEDAMHLYTWGKGAKVDSNKVRIPFSGTPVIVLDHYPFGLEFRPWMQISSNQSIHLKLPENPLKVDEPLIPIIQIPEEIRGALSNRQRYVIAEDSLRKLGVIREGVVLTPSINYNKLRRQKKAQELKEKMLQEKILQEQLENEELEKSNLDN